LLAVESLTSPQSLQTRLVVMSVVWFVGPFGEKLWL